MKNIISTALILCATMGFVVSASAADKTKTEVKKDVVKQDAGFVLTIKDHKFLPQELAIPAGQKVQITVKNMDKTPAEFESSDLNREKVVQGGSEIKVSVGPLNAGTYSFFDDFHRKTTTGTITVK